MSSRPDSLVGRVVAVTGGARGIGAAIGAEVVRRGASVALGDLDAAGAEAAAAKLGERAAGFGLDVTDSASFSSFLDAAEARFGPLDVLVNNAGIMWVGRFDEEPEAVALKQFDVNLHGVLRGMKLAAARMRVRGRGHVVNVASSASKIAPPGEATYCASKHAVYGYSVAVREELRGSGVDVSVVMPVVVETELAAGTSAGRGRSLQPADVAKAVADAIERPRFDVFVPRPVGAFVRALALLPDRARVRLARFAVPNQVQDTDFAARRGYEAERVGR
ncbi:MAG: SDR family NAD(P)-dependent oxidoreductase [Thermoleophilaceae bacterium]|nr:SDR family NAD(P)-dependent oxidoreductase [Thermoleophilaceae bacterium]